MSEKIAYRIEWWDGSNWIPEEPFYSIIEAINQYEELVRNYPDVHRRLIQVFKED